MSIRNILWLMSFGCFATLSPSVWAQELGTLESAMDRLGRLASDALKQEYRVNQVAIGDFSGTPQMQSHAHGSIATLLKKSLSKHGIEVTRRAEIGIKGSFAPAAVPHQKHSGVDIFAMRIELSFVDSRGEVLDTLVHGINSGGHSRAARSNGGRLVAHVTNEVAKVNLMGATSELPSDRPTEHRDQMLERSVYESQPHIKSNGIAASPESLYSVEILKRVHDRFVPLKPTARDGLAYVALKLGDSYAVRLSNHSDIDSAAYLAIDGLKMFAFSQDKLEFVVVPPRSSLVIEGWHHCDSQFNRFVIGRLGESAVAELGASKEHVGMITASFAAAWEVGTRPPSDELKAKRSRSGGEPIATKRGPLFEKTIQVVKRHVGVIRSVVTVRYEESALN